MAKQVSSDSIVTAGMVALFIASICDADPIWYFAIPAFAASALVIGDLCLDAFKYIKRTK